MIILRHKPEERQYSGKLTQTLYRGRRILKPSESKISSARKAITTRNNINAKAAEAISKQVHLTNGGAIDWGRTINKSLIEPSIETPGTAVALKTVPIPGTSALVKPIGKLEKKIQPKKVRNYLEEKSAQYKNNAGEKVANSINSGLFKMSEVGRMLPI